jgi:hypothetical protein
LRQIVGLSIKNKNSFLAAFDGLKVLDMLMVKAVAEKVKNVTQY